MFGIKIDASANNIPITFDNTAGSRLTTAAPMGSHLKVINPTSEVLALSMGDFQNTPLSDITINRNQYFIEPRSVTYIDDVMMSNRASIYLRSDGIVITSGIIRINLWSRQ